MNVSDQIKIFTAIITLLAFCPKQAGQDRAGRKESGKESREGKQEGERKKLVYASLSLERSRVDACSDSDCSGKMDSHHLRVSFSDAKHGELCYMKNIYHSAFSFRNLEI